MRISDWSSDVCSSDLFRRVRTLLIRTHECGLVATTLNFDYEVRSAKDAFSSIPKRKISDEMLELAEHIIKTKRGSFDPAKYDDRRSEEHTSELQSLMRISYAVFCLKKKKTK